MAMTPRWRKAVLVAHISTSVGWLGTVIAYIALDVAAITSRHAETVRAAWLARDVIVWYAIVPLALASVLIGVVNALSTTWGLFRHYWVVMKLLLTWSPPASCCRKRSRSAPWPRRQPPAPTPGPARSCTPSAAWWYCSSSRCSRCSNRVA